MSADVVPRVVELTRVNPFFSQKAWIDCVQWCSLCDCQRNFSSHQGSHRLVSNKPLCTLYV